MFTICNRSDNAILKDNGMRNTFQIIIVYLAYYHPNKCKCNFDTQDTLCITFFFNFMM